MAERPNPQSFAITSGENVTLAFTVTDNDGTAVDLTGGSGRFAMARRVGSSLDVDSNASPQSATIAVQNAAAGTVNVLIDDSITDSLSGDYLWEFKWTDSTGQEGVVAWGIMTFEDNLI